MKWILKAGAPLALRRLARRSWRSLLDAENKGTFRPAWKRYVGHAGGLRRARRHPAATRAPASTASDDQTLNLSLIPVGPDAGAHKTNEVTLHAAPDAALARDEHADRARRPDDLPRGRLRRRHPARTATGNFDELERLSPVPCPTRVWRLLRVHSTGRVLQPGGVPERRSTFGGARGELFCARRRRAGTQKLAAGELVARREEPGVGACRSGRSTTFRSDSDQVLDLVGRVRRSLLPRGAYSVGVLAREIHVDPPLRRPGQAAQGGALALTGIVPTMGRATGGWPSTWEMRSAATRSAASSPTAMSMRRAQFHLARQAAATPPTGIFWSPTAPRPSRRRPPTRLRPRTRSPASTRPIARST